MFPSNFNKVARFSRTCKLNDNWKAFVRKDDARVLCSDERATVSKARCAQKSIGAAHEIKRQSGKSLLYAGILAISARKIYAGLSRSARAREKQYSRRRRRRRVRKKSHNNQRERIKRSARLVAPSAGQPCISLIISTSEKIVDNSKMKSVRALAESAR